MKNLKHYWVKFWDKHFIGRRMLICTVIIPAVMLYDIVERIYLYCRRDFVKTYKEVYTIMKDMGM